MELVNSHFAEHAVNQGKDFPGFSLPGTHGKTYDSASLLKNGPLIVTFYKGSWSKPCSIQFSEYEKHLREWESLGAKIVAIFPELPANATALAAKLNLTFPPPLRQRQRLRFEPPLGIHGPARPPGIV